MNKTPITHVWPHEKLICPDAKPISDERQADVWDELRELTLDDEVRGDVVCITHADFNSEDMQDQIAEHFELGDCVIERVAYFNPIEYDRKVAKAATLTHTSFLRNARTGEKTPITSPALPRRQEMQKKLSAFSLKNRLDALQVIETRKQHQIAALVLWAPSDGDMAYLPMVREKCPDMPIYVFHAEWDDAKWGVEREGGAGNWEDEFPALADCKLDPKEVIIDDLLIKGNIHVAAGRFESYKTMAVLEWCSAILDQRPAHDYFTVFQRYPILYLCADMSPELLNEYAGLFNLQKHGADFRVRKPAGDILHSVDSPVVQAAVNGRILILDTMLDYAEIKNAFESGEWIVFMMKLRALMDSHGCIAVIVTAHATKSGAAAASIDPAAYLKDSATFGGKIDIGYAFKRVPESPQILVERIKGRGFKRPLKFTITINDANGDSYLDKGRFPVSQKPGEVTAGKVGCPVNPEKQRKLDFLQSTRGTIQERAGLLNAEFGTKHGKGTVGKWLDEIEFDKNEKTRR